MQGRLVASEGRISLALSWQLLGNDVQVVLEGGEAHIGAVALYPADAATVQTLELPSHREGPLAQSVARRLGEALHVTVCVSAGIHYQNISKTEIATVLSLADKLAAECEHCLLAQCQS